MSTSFSIDTKNILELSMTKRNLQRSINKHSPNKSITTKNTFKTPKTIVNNKTHYCLTGDRFIPIKTDKENYQNFLLKTSRTNYNNNSNINLSTLKNSPMNQKENRYSSFMLDSLLIKSADEFNIERGRSMFSKGNSKQMLSFSKKEKTKSNPRPFLMQMKNYFNSSNFLLDNKPSARTIPTNPERILDAPNLQDDFYLNLLDWGSLNVLSVALGEEVYLWNGDTAETSLLMTSENNSVSSISWMNSGNCLAIGFDNGDIELWDTVKGLSIRSMRGHFKRVSSLAWNNYLLSSGSKDNTIMNHDVRSKNHIISTLTSHHQEVCALKYNNDGSYLASGSNDNMVYIWDVKRINNKLQSLIVENESDIAIKPSYTMSSHCAAVKALSWCPWQRSVLATGGGTKDKSIQFFNIDTNSVINSVNTGSQVCALLWNKREREVISSHGFNKNQICIWNYPKMTKVTELKGHMSRVLYLVMSPDETTIVSGAGDETLRFWKINDKINEISREEEEEMSYNLKIR